MKTAAHYKVTGERRYEIAGVSFKTQDEIKQHIRCIVAAHKNGQTLDKQHRTFVLALLDANPFKSLKVGSGIKRIFVDKAKDHSSRGFWIERTDATRQDWSWQHFFHTETDRDRMLQGMRDGVADQIAAYRAKPLQICENLDCLVEDDPEDDPADRPVFEVDHAAPLTFARLADKFFEIYGYRSPKDMIYRPEGGGWALLPPDLLSWQKFHKRRAVLQLLCAPCHKAKTARDASQRAKRS